MPKSRSCSMENTKKFSFSQNGEKDAVVVTIIEMVDPEYGMFTWPCAPVLGQFLVQNEEKLIGRTILELGAGTALPGIIAAKFGANVILSDAGHFPKCLANAVKSCRLNNINKRVRAVPLTWGDFTPALLDLPSIDIIISSDCFYNPPDFENIIATIAFIIERNPSCVFWCTYQVRSCSWSIEHLLQQWNLKCSHIPLSSFEGSKDNIGGQKISNQHTIEMLEITRAP